MLAIELIDKFVELNTKRSIVENKYRIQKSAELLELKKELDEEINNVFHDYLEVEKELDILKKIVVLNELDEKISKLRLDTTEENETENAYKIDYYMTFNNRMNVGLFLQVNEKVEAEKTKKLTNPEKNV